MKAISFSHALILLLCSMTAISSNAQESSEAITFVAAGPLPNEAQKLLANLARTTSIEIAPASDPFEALRANCGGSFTNDYYQLVKEQNPEFIFKATNNKRNLTLPACAKINTVATNATARVLPGDNLASVVRRYFGVKLGTLVAPCTAGAQQVSGKDCNVRVESKVSALNGGIRAELDKPLRAGRELTLPWSARPTTVALKDGVDAKTAVAQLLALNSAASQKQMALPFANVAPAAGLKLIRTFNSDDPALDSTPCAKSASIPAYWPFDQTQVISVVEAGIVQAEKKNVGKRVSVIRVADTGVSGLSTFFPQIALSINRYEKPNVARDIDKNGFYGDYYGIDSDESGSVEPFENDASKQHGTQVADVALGGYALRNAYPKIYELLKLDVAKIFWQPGAATIVNDSAFVSAIRSIRNHTMPSVVNFSVGASSENNTKLFLQSLQDAPQLNFLAVIAAGNSHKDIANQELTYPAAYGGGGSVASRWIMSVGASDPSGMPTVFTNFSSERVDILAPGCKIPFRGEDGSNQSLNGTSIAAPLVSFTAGVIHALGVDSMADVKTRIIVSADYRASLANFTRYGGVVLNVERAVAVHQDSIRIKKESADRRGRWIRSDDDLSICENPALMDPRDVMSITAFDQGGEVWLRYLTLAKDGALNDPRYCKADSAGLKFQNQNGTTLDVAWRDLDTFVPAFPVPGMVD